MAINRASKAVTFERWEDVPRTGPAHLSTPIYNPGMVQSVTIVEGVTYVGPALEIPAAKLYDLPLPPNLAPNAFEFTAQDLNAFNSHYWDVLQ
jgi:hypothetical protein